jgi:hypothetical protein
MKPIEETPVLEKTRDAMYSVIRALLAIYRNEEYRNKVLDVVEAKLTNGKKATGRPGLTFWQIFVLAEFRMGLDLTYDRLHSMAFSDSVLRQLLGIESVGFNERVVFSRKRIQKNVRLLSDEDLQKINSIIVDFGHKEVFVEKKREDGLKLKTDSFPVQTMVHFPSDHSLLNDSARKAGDTMKKIIKKEEVTGWRKLKDWINSLKNLQRAYSKANSSGGKNKQIRTLKAADAYLTKAKAFSKKLRQFIDNPTISNPIDVVFLVFLVEYVRLLDKHIDLFYRRVKLGEEIPHEEKMFSIFEQYSEWISKGKRNVEIGKNTLITTDQYGLIIDYHILENETDSQTVTGLRSRILSSYKVYSWSFDKGFWKKENFEILSKSIDMVVMPKKGKPNKEEKARENEAEFKRLRKKHSAVESNINELEHSGLHRCRDKGYEGFKRYVGMGVVAYNLKRIGRELLGQDRIKRQKAA